MRKFNEKFLTTGFSKIQIQEKEKELKASYRVLRDAKRNSGAGWNDTLCSINATAEEWDTIYKVGAFTACYTQEVFLLLYIYML